MSIDWARLLSKLLVSADWVVMGILILQCTLYLVQLFAAYLELRLHKQRVQQADPWWLLKSDVTFPISILVPAYNEEATIVENIRSLLALRYPDFEVIVINDGSKDRTLEVAIEALGLHPVNRSHELVVEHKKIRGLYGHPSYPRLLVVDKENGGKSDALNAGINLSRAPLFCAVDADSILDADALLRVIRPFVEEPEDMVAVGGRIRIVNGCTVRAGQVVEFGLPKHWLPLLQTIEYIRAFLIARLAWSRFGVLLIISGAFGVFKRSAAIQVGGYSHGTVGEDMEIVVKLHRHFLERKLPYQMRYVPDPVCWTEAPNRLAIMRSQRTRWQRGMMECLLRHRVMIFSPRYGRIGWLGMGNFLVFDLIEPVIELTGLILVPASWAAALLNTQFLFAYLMLTFVFGVFLSTTGLLLEELAIGEIRRARDLALLAFCSLAENFGFRQLNNLWRIEGIWQFLRKKKGWGTMTRTGFQKKPEPAAKAPPK